MTVTHHLQRDILDALARAHSLRFSQLKPAGLESNIFMYHLKQLIKAGLVEKDEAAYRLAPKGLTYVDRLSSQNLQPRLQPKVITILVIRDTKGKVALLRRNTQPYIHCYMLPSGKLHFGEKAADHARREAQEKLGVAAEMSLCGVVNIRISQAQEPLTHVVARVMRATVEPQELSGQDERFVPEWVSRADVKTLRLMPGTAEVINLAERPELFVEDLSFD